MNIQGFTPSEALNKLIFFEIQEHRIPSLLQNLSDSVSGKEYSFDQQVCFLNSDIFAPDRKTGTGCSPLGNGYKIIEMNKPAKSSRFSGFAYFG